METEMTAEAVGLAAATATAIRLREAVDEKEAELKRLKAELADSCDVIKKTLDLAGLESVRANGYLFFKENKTSVSIPKSLEDKRKLFEFLTEKGIFLEMVSVNSMTLNSLYKSLAEQALNEGVLDYRMPGVAEPVNYVNLKIRKG